MVAFQFLNLARPFLSIIPEVLPPARKVQFNEKVVWTAAVLLIFLVGSILPLYGIQSFDEALMIPLDWMGVSLSLNKGTPMGLGISSVLICDMIMGLLASLNLIQVNFNLKGDLALYKGASKLFSFIISLSQATIYVHTGVYGPPQELGVCIRLLLVIQLVAATLIVTLLDELLRIGYGFGSAIDLFRVTDICGAIVWKAFSPTIINTGRGPEFEGVIVALFHLLITWDDKRRALREVFWRDGLPNIMGFVAAIIIFVLVVFLEGFRIEMPIKSNKIRGQYGIYSVKLFYASTLSTPVTYQYAFASIILNISRILFNRFPDSFLTHLIGVWEPMKYSSQLAPKSGIAYYISAPRTIQTAILDPIHMAIYVTFVLITCACFSKAWMGIICSESEVIPKHLEDRRMVIVGHEDSMYKEVKRVMSAVAALGGAILGLLSVAANLMGAPEHGTRIFVVVVTICSYWKMSYE